MQPWATELLSELFKTYYYPLVGFAYKRSAGDRDLAEDFVAIAFRKATENLGGRDTQPAWKPEQWHAWMYQILQNVIRDHYRHVKLVAFVPLKLDTHEQTAPPTFDPDLVTHDYYDIPAALAAIRPDRAALLIRYYTQHDQGLTLYDIADDMGLSYAGIKSKLFKARLAMRQQLTRQRVADTTLRQETPC